MLLVSQIRQLCCPTVFVKNRRYNCWQGKKRCVMRTMKPRKEKDFDGIEDVESKMKI